jgi:PAS domain S-box-containing protein
MSQKNPEQSGRIKLSIEEMSDLIDDGFVVIKDSRIVSANNAGLQIMGMNQDEIIGKLLVDFAEPAFQHRLDEKLALKDTAETIDVMLKRSDDSILDVRLHISRETPGGERIVFMSDMTGSKSRESMLEQSSLRYREFTEMIHQGFFETDQAGRIMFANDIAFSRYGYSSDDVAKGLSLLDMVSPEDLERARANMINVLAGINTQGSTYFAMKKDGTRFPVEVYSAPIVRNGIIVGLRGIIVDISERVNRDSELSTIRSLLHAAIEEITTGIIVIDSVSGRMQIANSTALEMLGFWEYRNSDKPIWEFIPDWKAYYPDGREWNPEDMPLAHAIRGETQENVEIRIVGSDGMDKWILCHASPVYNDAGDLIAGVILFSDVTAKKNIDAEQDRHQRLESIGMLASGVAHDFNNLLTAIIGNINLLKLEEQLTEEMTDMVKDAENAAMRAKDLISQLLAFSRGGDPVKSAVSIELLIREAAARASHGTGIKISYKIDERLREGDVDGGQMSQALHGLFGHIIESAGSDGSVVVCIGNQDLEDQNDQLLPPGQYINVEISHSGKSLSDVDQKRIFDLYYSSNPMSSGMGLSIAYSIIHAHGGSLGVRSTAETGTIFDILIPAVKDDPMSEATASVYAEIPAQGGRLLVIEDDKTVQGMLSRMIALVGYSVDFVDDGALAKDKYCESITAGERYVAVITDLNIPGGMGGKDAVREILSVDAEARVIVTSGNSSDPAVTDFEAHGFCAALLKPYRIGDLTKALDQAIRRER